KYDKVDWALNDKVAYFFPEKPSVYVANESKTGSWNDINTQYGAEGAISGDLFTLWFDHGVKPAKEKYAYIIVPNISSASEANAYQVSDIEILANNDTVQAVYHKGLKTYGLTFFREGAFKSGDLIVDASGGCVMLVKAADLSQLSVWVADPQKQDTPIKLGIKTPLIGEMKAVTYQNPASPHQGKSLEFTVDNETAAYAGKDVLLDRTDWEIICSSEGPTDATVAPLGDYPRYIADGDNKTAFLFVKPGKTYGGVTVPSGAKPYFMIDLKESREMTYLIYRHRDYSNTTTALRASKGSFYGKNDEADEFQPIVENFDIATGVAEVRIDFPQKVSYRYVKFVYEAWDEASGYTIQVSEFNLGNTELLGSGVGSHPFVPDNTRLSIFPNPATDDVFYIAGLPAGTLVEVYSLNGTLALTANNPTINISGLPAGMYIVRAAGKAAKLVKR
ncbi:MAG: polysaccharide lyase beta-sandwich domain-containing protein, partial [Prevotella sp.]|nr:polysaccharide lyase beta-sandwich domain-containing protein [Prevotella sp.]